MSEMQREQWLRLHNSAALDYEVTLTTARGLPFETFMKYADRLYADAHMASQARDSAARKIQEG